MGVVGAWLVYREAPQRVEDPVDVTNSEAVEKVNASDHESESVQQLLLGNTSVQQYLKRQTDKQALQDYFNNLENDVETANKIWLQIEEIEGEGGILAFEALHLKMAWLEKNTANRAEFEEKAKNLLAHYQEKSRASTEKYNPENTPEFKNYKAQELQIIQEVNQLEAIPRGLSREEYLREKLLAARIEAYGEGTQE